MISEINFANVKRSEIFSYAGDLGFFKDNISLKFQPGVNVLFGPNGCGKSTILRMAAIALAAEKGGVSTVTESWVRTVVGHDSKSRLDGVDVIHDGQGIMYGNPRNAIGLIGGGAAFDDDFMMEGVRNITSKASTGFTTMGRLEKMLSVMLGESEFPIEIDHRIGGHSGSSYSQATNLLKGRVPKSSLTMILDEPESGLAIPVQHKLFSMIFEAALRKNFQIIIATHSIFALGLPEANYIEMSKDYIAQSRNSLALLDIRMKMDELNREGKFGV